MTSYLTSARDRLVNYLEHFHLQEDPFGMTPDPFYFFPSLAHNELIHSLDYAVEQKEGFFLATGEPGTGKTTTLKAFISKWTHRADIALVMTPRVSPKEFIALVLEDLRIAAPSEANRVENLKAFRNYLLEDLNSSRRVIIIVDEAQELPDETIEELRLLSNLETEKEKLIQIILVGQPELRNKLLTDSFRQLNQRITVRTVLKPLSIDETLAYIGYRLLKAGGMPAIIEENAKKLIYRLSSGLPRLINLISSRALMTAFLKGSSKVRTSHVRYAGKHLSENLGKQLEWPSKRWALVLFVPLIIVIVIYAAKDFDIDKAHEIKTVAKSNESVPVQKPLTALPYTQTEVKGKEEPDIDKRKTITVLAKSANLRARPTVKANIVAWASHGSIFEIYDELRDENGWKWYRVKTSAGKDCWIAENIVRTENSP